MAKKELKWLPGLGWFSAAHLTVACEVICLPWTVLMSGTVFINRSNNKSAVASMAQAGEDMKRKRVRGDLQTESDGLSAPKRSLTDYRSLCGSSPRVQGTCRQSPIFCHSRRGHSTSQSNVGTSDPSFTSSSPDACSWNANRPGCLPELPPSLRRQEPFPPRHPQNQRCVTSTCHLVHANPPQCYRPFLPPACPPLTSPI
jgi:hypothetical protein